MLDYLFRGARVVDGTGGASRQADVGVENGRIAGVGRLGDAEAHETIDAAGKVVCPGFIDIHTHNDLYVIRDDYVDVFEPYLRQGITTCVANNCGWSVAPWPVEHSALMCSTLRSMGVARDLEPQWETQADFHDWLVKRGLPMNMVPQAAHGPIRMRVMGQEARFSTPEELEAMKGLVADAMEAGCRGFSTGLTYFPGMYAHTDELVELATVSREAGGRYATHTRGLSQNFDRAVAEAVEVARRSDSALQISHFMAAPELGWTSDLIYYAVGALEAVNRAIPLPGIPNAALEKAVGHVDRALEEGIDIGMDFIPYVLGNTTVTQLYPPWANMGGTDALLERLRDPATRERIRNDVRTIKPTWPNWVEGAWSDNYLRSLGWKMFRILSVGSEKNNRMEGRRVVELAREAGKDPFDFLADLTVEEDGAVMFLMGLPPRPWTEKVFTRIQKHPQLSVGADSLFPEKGAPPLSAYGCFVRVIEHYVKELGFYTLEDAMHRTTGLAASRYGLDDRGAVREGAAADLACFDLESIHDNSTWDDPEHYPDGIDYVMVNGRMVVEQGTYHGDALAGRLLTR
ncbi:MAG: amidohydrolase family protein [Actinobacteria bacterium]|nr:amidohydrolase family protein [Actinomycetota bacterium]MBU1943089.1 amidohydrolase family protein [Actinomycetota bacterium]MBU2687964.1 amidohydrolase family protein [Actinomycetota bacterium]